MAAPAVVEVNAHIEKKGIYGLNEAKGCGALALLNGGIARSDVDSQLILCFPFSQTVKLSALVLTAPLDEAPTELRLYVNRAALGFEDLEEVDPAMTSEFRGERGYLYLSKIISPVFLFLVQSSFPQETLALISS